VKCEDRDPDAANDGVALVGDIRNQSAVFWFGMVAIVGSAMTGPSGTDHPAQVGTMCGSFRSLKPRP
jgi:hypothetical protein